jgi:hypothetical protein
LVKLTLILSHRVVLIVSINNNHNYDTKRKILQTTIRSEMAFEEEGNFE